MQAQDDKAVPYRSTRMRFVMLAITSLVVFSNHYSFNNPQALEQYLKSDLNINDAQYQLLYTVFAVPNIFSCFFLGYFVDYFGVKLSLNIFSCAIVVFQSIIAVGGYIYSYDCILIARIFFGMASGGLICAVAAIISIWFKGKQLSFAFSVAVTLPELGNALNGAVTPLIYEASGSLGTALIASAGICVFSLGCAITAACLDTHADQMDQQNGVVMEMDEDEDGQIRCSDVKEFTGTFWLVAVIYMLSLSIYSVFLNGITGLLRSRFCYSQVTASRALVITYVVSAVFSPPLGILIDRIGHKRYFIMLSMVMYLGCQLTLLLWPQCDTSQQTGTMAALLMLGIGYCFFGNSVVPAVPLVMKRRVTGTGFGIVQIFQSVALASFPIIDGTLVDSGSTKEIGYRYSSGFFLAISVVGLITTFGLFCIPEKYKKKFDKVPKPPRKVIGEDGKTTYIQSQEDSESSSGAQSVRSGRSAKKRVTIEIVKSPSINSQVDPIKQGLLQQSRGSLTLD